MPRGDKSAYTDKQKRKAEHIEEGYEKSGLGRKEAARRAWATAGAQGPRITCRLVGEGLATARAPAARSAVSDTCAPGRLFQLLAKTI